MCEELEMPTPCQKCGEIFDLTDGYGSEKWFPNTVICNECHTLEAAEIEKDEEIEELVNLVEDAEYNLIEVRNRLSKLEVDVPDKINSVYRQLNEVHQLKNILGKEKYTWNDLAADIAKLPAAEREKRAFVVIDDEPSFRMLPSLETIAEDVYVNDDDDDDCGDLKTLMEAHGHDFRLEDYRLSTRKGTPFLWTDF